jgi:hypothetical protein
VAIEIETPRPDDSDDRSGRSSLKAGGGLPGDQAIESIAGHVEHGFHFGRILF